MKGRVDMKNVLTVENAIFEYKELLKGQSHADSTKRDYERKADLFLKYLKDHKINLIQNVNHYHINAFLEEITDVKKLSDKTVYKYYVVIQSVFKQLSSCGFIENNPFQCITLKKPKSAQIQEYFCPKAVDMLLDIIKNQSDSFHSLMDYTYAVFLNETGLRRTDSIHLLWNNINMIDKTMMIYISKNHSYIKLTLSDKLYNAFWNLYKIDRPKQYDYVFQENPGVKLNKNEMTARFAKYVAELRSIYPMKTNNDMLSNEYMPLPEKITPHTLKHSFITRKFIEGYNALEISKLTGNRDLQTIISYRDSIPTDAFLLSTALNQSFKAA